MTPPRSRADKRLEHYQRVHEHGRRYREYDPPSVDMALSLVYTYDVFSNCLSRMVGRHGLSLSGFNVLRILGRMPGHMCPLHEVGELLLVSRANVTGLIDSLADKGLVERVPDPCDRRVRLARLTGAGEQLMEEILPGHFAELKALCAGLDDAEKAHLSELLGRLRDGMAGASEKAAP